MEGTRTQRKHWCLWDEISKSDKWAEARREMLRHAANEWQCTRCKKDMDIYVSAPYGQPLCEECTHSRL